MGRKVIDITKQRFGLWTVLKFAYSAKSSYWLCRCECGNIKTVNGNSLKRGETLSCGCISKIVDISGQKFDRLTVIKYDCIKNKQTHWLCRCICGNIVSVRSSSLQSGNTRSCGCLSKEMISERSWLGIEEISGALISRIKTDAKKRNIGFCVTKENIWEQYLKQNRKCNLSGIDIRFTRSYNDFKEQQTASLDRIDSNKDYTTDNIQWVHKDINVMKWDLCQNEFLHLVCLVCNPISDDGIYNSYSLDPIHSTKHSNWRGYGNFSIKKYKLYIRHAIDRHIYFNISIQDCWKLFIKQNGKCAITGMKLTMSACESKVEHTASLDRIDNKYGYTIDNVQWVHKNINQMKLDFTTKDFLYYCHIINCHQMSSKL